MNINPWIGGSLNSNIRVLILGESHYDEENNLGANVTFSTSGVVEYYFKKRERWAPFFDKIAASFGYDIDNARSFYEQVCFGNYVDVVCGVGDNNCARYYINLNRIKYNSDLFKFVNEYSVDVVVCFSKLVYSNLPKIGSKDEHWDRKTIGKIGNRNNNVDICFYRKDVVHDFCDVKLQNDLKVYGVRHPSARGGFKSEQVYQFMIKQDDVRSICKL